jgi:prolipoprotein diacylglyceryltransferase
LICLFLLTLEPFLPLNGYLFATWITVYPPARFLLEVIRTDEGSFAGTGLTISQNMSLVLSLLAIGFWVYLWRRKTDRLPKKAESAASAPSE